jgi:hypothetical protein
MLPVRNDTFVGCTGVTLSADQDSHPLMKSYISVVVRIWAPGLVLNSYLNWNSHLPSLFQSIFLVTITPAVLLLLMLCIATFRLLLRLLRYMLMDIKRTSASSVPRTATCTTSTCTLSDVKLTMNVAVCQFYVVIDRVTNKLIGCLSAKNRTVSGCFISRLHVVYNSLTYTASTELPRTHTVCPEISPCSAETSEKWPRTRRVVPGLGSATERVACRAVGCRSARLGRPWWI